LNVSVFENSLSGKVALITGASRGIGQAIAESLAEAGAQVILASRKQDQLDRVAAQIQASGGEALAIATHTGDPEAVAKLLSHAKDAYGGVDILVNNAATNPHFGPILSAEDSYWMKTFEVNVLGYVHLAKACIDPMVSRGGGKIINIASIAGKTPLPGMGIYCVTKAAVLMLTEVLAAELAADNIQVNAVVPGFVRTRFSQVLWDNPQIYETIIKNIPQGRMADPKEIASAVLFLSSPASTFTTGAALVVDGGQLIGHKI
jgi:NAD(P)-dependent dehydrogenase (short-subunit alcohol dehydrogenase family)